MSVASVTSVPPAGGRGRRRRGAFAQERGGERREAGSRAEASVRHLECCLPSCRRPGRGPASADSALGVTSVSETHATSRARPRPAGAARGAGIVARGRRLRRVFRTPGCSSLVRPHKPAPLEREFRRVLAPSQRPLPDSGRGPARPAGGAGLRLRYESPGAARRGRGRPGRLVRRRDRRRRRRPRRHRRPEVLRGRARALLDALGVRLEIPDGTVLSAPGGRGARGEPAPGTLVVANHVSWLDAVALLAVEPVTLLAKREVGDWPVLGPMVRRAGTRFIDRGSLRGLPGTVEALAGLLRAGRSVAVFPEGITHCSAPGGRFRPAAFQ
ncbi:hypothetical protein GTY57_15615, partial [Streptomyces sp. SID5475]|nr:hypothetical protein [Streptomyces sp. SID5475]